jgi:protoporphyrinogen IX oxidase
MSFLNFETVKALHIIFVISWFAGLFYMVRLFIYHVEAQEKEPVESKILSEQFKIMQHKLWYIITTPAMILTLIFGLGMLFYSADISEFYLAQSWMHVKLGFVALLLVYHFICHKIMLDFKVDSFKWTSTQLRLWNELATLFLVIIVFVVVLKDSLNWWKGTLGFFAVGIILMLAVKMYKRIRSKND